MPPREMPRTLLETQRLMATAIMRPLGKGNRTQRTWIDGRSTAEAIAPLMKPNDRLTGLERLEIYNRQYWFRLLDCLHDDFPGLRGILGAARFARLSRAYLEACPSRSFSLRNLGQFLPGFIESHRQLTAPRSDLAHDMARFEWAQIEAFDGPGARPLSASDVARIAANPARAKLALQPYLHLLELRYPLDDFLLALKKKDAALRSEASNTVAQPTARRVSRRPRLPRAQLIHLAVHRFENALYYKRLTPEAFATLQGLRSGKTIAAALSHAIAKSSAANQDWPVIIREWFDVWTRLNWLCSPVSTKK